MTLFVVECINPGLSCCEYRLTSKTPADNVCRVIIYCGKWRENSKDGIIHNCEE